MPGRRGVEAARSDTSVSYAGLVRSLPAFNYSRVLWQAKQERRLPHDLVDRRLDRWASTGEAASGVDVMSLSGHDERSTARFNSLERIQVQRNDCVAIAELLDVLPGAEQAVEVVEVAQGAEERRDFALLVADDDSSFTSAFDFVAFDDGSRSLEGVRHDLLVDVQRVGGDL